MCEFQHLGLIFRIKVGEYLSSSIANVLLLGGGGGDLILRPCT